MIEHTNDGDSVTFSVRAVPRASRTVIAGEQEGALRVRVAAPPVEGAANHEMIRFFAKFFGVARSRVQIVSGESSRTKRVRVAGVTSAEFSRVVARNLSRLPASKSA